MPITIDFGTLIITVPQSELTSLGGSLFELDTEGTLRADINAIMDDEEGMPFPTPINHNTEVVLAGVTYARTIEFINGYTVSFSVEAQPYRVNLVGSNNNLTDVLNLTDASVIPSNSAGLIVGPGSGLSAAQATQLLELYGVHGLILGTPLEVNDDQRSFGAVVQDIDEDTPVDGTVRITRQ